MTVWLWIYAKNVQKNEKKNEKKRETLVKIYQMQKCLTKVK